MKFFTDESQTKLSIGLSILTITLMAAAAFRLAPYSAVLGITFLDFLFQLWRYSLRRRQL